MNIGKVAEMSNPVPSTTPKSSVEQIAKKDTTTATDNPKTDKFVRESEATYTPAYTKHSSKTQHETDKNKDVKVEHKSARAMKNEAFKSMVAEIIGKQSGAAWNAIMKDADKIQNGTIDDYWSADATAQRIYDFARNLAGDDDSKLEELRAAVEKGFAQAGAAFSKKTGMKGLPSICQDTYKKVMGMFDDWAKEAADKKAAKTDTDKKAD